MAAKKTGKIVIISSPSGGGKTSICRKLLSPTRRKAGWSFSVSYTTREPRPNEKNGRQYNFVNDQQFNTLVRKDFFAEHFKVHRYQYGTPRKAIEQAKRSGGVIVLDIDVQGARRLKKEYPEAISIFVLPPSKAILKKRLKKRGTETAVQLKVRLENAISEMETFRKYGFEYYVINNELDAAVRQVLGIIEAHGCRLDRVDAKLIERVLG